MAQDTTYRGYRIRVNFLHPDLVWIEKDGRFISYAEGVDAAKEAIDGLL